MARPPQRNPLYADALTDSVARGDMAAVRAHFDKVLWGDSEQRPTWDQLQIAVQQNDVPMARLLVTWGARATEADLAVLQKAAPKKYPDYLQTLRRAGHGISPQALRESALQAAALPDSAANESLENTIIKAFIDDRFIDYRAGRLPQEWRQVLHTLQQTGASEAMIGGGALRDLFNERAIKDVDIFLQSRGSENKNRKFIKQAFQKAGLSIEKQVVARGMYGGEVREELPDPKKSVFQARLGSSYGTIRAASNSEAWTVIAGKDKTEYNVVFVDGPLGKMLKAAAEKDGASSAAVMIKAFDLGLCQIGFDGEKIVVTDAYREDVTEKKITLHVDNGTSQQHIARVVKKYPDWKLSPEADKALNPPPAPKPQPRRSYSGYGGWSSY
ncbi:MAG: hypothetical protein Q8K65_07720 [Alphaproteobacteria bacterium]|nr:hypothetical protein [Alphaproteobacteria bacterium]